MHYHNQTCQIYKRGERKKNKKKKQNKNKQKKTHSLGVPHTLWLEVQILSNVAYILNKSSIITF